MERRGISLMWRSYSKTKWIGGSVSLVIGENRMQWRLRNTLITPTFRHPKSKWSLPNWLMMKNWFKAKCGVSRVSRNSRRFSRSRRKGRISKKRRRKRRVNNNNNKKKAINWVLLRRRSRPNSESSWTLWNSLKVWIPLHGMTMW